MQRELRNFKLEIWLTEAQANAVKAVADAQESTESAIGRQAVKYFLQSIGAMPQPNGHRKPMKQTEEMAHG